MFWQAIPDTQRLTPCGRSVMPFAAAVSAELGNAKAFGVRWSR
jgi:hypothetical protein